MKKLLVPAIVMVGLIMAGCPKGGPADFSPLAVGDKWEYDFMQISSLSIYIPDTTTTVDTIMGSQKSEVIGNDALDSGESVFVVVNTSVRDTLTRVDTSYARKSADSLYIYNSKSDSVADYVEPLDLTVGTIWVQKLDTLTAITYKVESDTADISVPFGGYSNCLMISVTTTPAPQYSTMTTLQFRAADVGMVKTTTDATVEVPNISKSVMTSKTELKTFVK